MHIARIGTDGDLDGKHPDVPVRRDRNGNEGRAERSYSQQKTIVSSYTRSAQGKKGRLQFIGRKTHILTRTDATLTHAAGGNIQSPLSRDIVT